MPGQQVPRVFKVIIAIPKKEGKTNTTEVVDLTHVDRCFARVFGNVADQCGCQHGTDVNPER